MRQVQFLQTVHLVAWWLVVAQTILPDIPVFPLLVSLDDLCYHLSTVIVQLICGQVDLLYLKILTQTWYEYFKHFWLVKAETKTE